MLFQLCVLAFAAVSLPTARAASPVALIGEETVDDVDAYAEKVEMESEGLLDAPCTDWDFYGSYDRGLSVFSRPVVASKLLLVRSSVEVDKSASELFQLLISEEGSKIIDDTTSHEPQPREVLQWRDRATITYSKTIPAKFPFGQRSFVKASFFDSGKKMLVSKSVLYAPLPEGGDGTIRAFNSFALRAVPLGAQRCRLEMVDYFDMKGWFVTWVANKFHTGTFYQSLTGRLWRHLDAAGRQAVPSSVA